MGIPSFFTNLGETGFFAWLSSRGSNTSPSTHARRVAVALICMGPQRTYYARALEFLSATNLQRANGGKQYASPVQFDFSITRSSFQDRQREQRFSPRILTAHSIRRSPATLA